MIEFPISYGTWFVLVDIRSQIDFAVGDSHGTGRHSKRDQAPGPKDEQAPSNWGGGGWIYSYRILMNIKLNKYIYNIRVYIYKYIYIYEYTDIL